MQTDFVVIDADWDLDEILRKLTLGRTSLVVIRRNENWATDPLFYVFDREYAVRMIETAPHRLEMATVDVRSALDLHESDAARTFQLGRAIPAGEGAVVMLRNGEPAACSTGDTTRATPPPMPAAANGGGRTAATRDGGGGGGPVREPLMRFPDLDMDGVVTIGEPASLTVGLLLKSPDGTTSAIPIADEGEEPPFVEIVLRARGFTIDGTNTQVVQVAREKDTEVRFKLIAALAGEREVRVDFYQSNRPIGSISRTISVVSPGAATAAVPSPPNAAIEFTRAGAPVQDLELRILTDEHVDGMLYFELTASDPSLNYHHSKVGFKKVGASPLEEMKATYDELSKMAGPAPATAEMQDRQRDRIASLSREAWDKWIPDDLKDEYWKFRGHVQSLLITSAEPWVPWEIVKPYRSDDNGQVEDAPHWCESFDLSRWLAGTGMPDSVDVKQIRPCVPKERNLPAADRERAFLESITGLYPPAVADVNYPDFTHIKELLEAGTFNVLHVAAHGAFNGAVPDNSTLTLDGGALRPSDIHTTFIGMRPRPLVFFNACHGGRGGPSAFTGLGGWASKLVACRVGAFAGAAWEVNDELALIFAKEFYAALLGAKMTFAESLRAARKAARDKAPWNSTWLAYLLYADPEARPVC